MRRAFPLLVLTAISTLLLTLIAPVAFAAATAGFAKASDWGSGYEGKYTITNGTPAAISGWRVEFDLPSGTTVGTYWDSLLTATGSHYRFTNREYNGTIAHLHYRRLLNGRQS